jgi:hypothetical protein
MRAPLMTRWLVAGACFSLPGCAAEQPVVPPPVATPAPAVANQTAQAATPETRALPAAPARVAGRAQLGGRAFAGASVSAYLVGGPETAVATGTTGTDGTFALDLDPATKAGALVRVVVASGTTHLAALLPAQTPATAGYSLAAAGGASVDARTTLVVLLFQQEINQFAGVLRTANEQALHDFSHVLDEAVAHADAVITKLGAAFESQLVTQVVDLTGRGILPAPMAQAIATQAVTEVNQLLKGFHDLNAVLASTGSKEAQTALDQPQPIDLGNGVKLTPPDAPATTTTATATAGGSGGGGSGGGGSGGGGSGGGGTTTTTANLTVAGNLAVPGVTPHTVTVGGSLLAPTRATSSAPSLVSLAVRTEEGATVFDLTFSAPVFGWENATLYSFAAGSQTSDLPLAATVGTRTAAGSLTDHLWHSALGGALTTRGDVDPRIVHLYVANTATDGFVPQGAQVVRIHVAPGITDQDGTAMSTGVVTADFGT